jgi:hypothetical protein
MFVAHYVTIAKSRIKIKSQPIKNSRNHRSFLIATAIPTNKANKRKQKTSPKTSTETKRLENKREKNCSKGLTQIFMGLCSSHLD